MWKSVGQHLNGEQGHQILAQLNRIVYSWQFVKNCSHCWATFFRSWGYSLILTKKGLGYILGDFLTNLSGRPDGEPRTAVLCVTWIELCCHVSSVRRVTDGKRKGGFAEDVAFRNLLKFMVRLFVELLLRNYVLDCLLLNTNFFNY
jgi:hypothetical protein